MSEGRASAKSLLAKLTDDQIGYLIRQFPILVTVWGRFLKLDPSLLANGKPRARYALRVEVAKRPEQLLHSLSRSGVLHICGLADLDVHDADADALVFAGTTRGVLGDELFPFFLTCIAESDVAIAPTVGREFDSLLEAEPIAPVAVGDVDGLGEELVDDLDLQGLLEQNEKLAVWGASLAKVLRDTADAAAAGRLFDDLDDMPGAWTESVKAHFELVGRGSEVADLGEARDLLEVLLAEQQQDQSEQLKAATERAEQSLAVRALLARNRSPIEVRTQRLQHSPDVPRRQASDNGVVTEQLIIDTCRSASQKKALPRQEMPGRDLSV